MTGSNDPMKGMVRAALLRARVKFVEGDKNKARLDFYLPDANIYIEVKQFHSDRIGAQMSRASNVIALQGHPTVEWFAAMLVTQPPRPMVRTPDFDSGNRGSNPREAASPTPEAEIASTQPLSKERFAAIWKHEKWPILAFSVFLLLFGLGWLVL